jgi:hypothetical protein
VGADKSSTASNKNTLAQRRCEKLHRRETG